MKTYIVVEDYCHEVLLEGTYEECLEFIDERTCSGNGGQDMSVFEVGEEGAFLEQDHDEIPS